MPLEAEWTEPVELNADDRITAQLMNEQVLQNMLFIRGGGGNIFIYDPNIHTSPFNFTMDLGSFNHLLIRADWDVSVPNHGRTTAGVGLYTGTAAVLANRFYSAGGSVDSEDPPGTRSRGGRLDLVTNVGSGGLTEIHAVITVSGRRGSFDGLVVAQL